MDQQQFKASINSWEEIWMDGGEGWNGEERYARSKETDHDKSCGSSFSFCQVQNNKLLKMDYFFTWHIVLGVGKSQDLPSKIWQTLEDAHGDSE